MTTTRRIRAMIQFCPSMTNWTCVSKSIEDDGGGGCGVVDGEMK